MRFARRSLLVGGIGLLSGCASSPVVSGTPQPVNSPTPVPQSPLLRDAAAALAAFKAEISPEAGPPAWRDAALNQCDAQLSRLCAADPLTGGPQLFEPPAATSSVGLQSAAKTSSETLRGLAAKAPSQAERLLLASIAAAVLSASNPQLPPVPGQAAPGPLPKLSLPEAIQVAVTRIWSLIHGLEVGLGRLDDKPLAAAGTARLATALAQRDTWLAELTELPDREIAYELPTPMTTAREIRLGWASLEQQLLNAQARIAAADDQHPQPRIAAMVASVAAVQRLGGRLPYWPGWATD